MHWVFKCKTYSLTFESNFNFIFKAVDGPISFVTETKEQANYKQISQTSRASDRKNSTFTQSACESSTFTESMFANHQ